MSPTRRDLLRSLAGAAVVAALPAGRVARAALPETATPEPFPVAPGVDVLDPAPMWGYDEWADWFDQTMRQGFPHVAFEVEAKRHDHGPNAGGFTIRVPDGENVALLLNVNPATGNHFVGLIDEGGATEHGTIAIMLIGALMAVIASR